MWANEPNILQTGDPLLLPTTAKACWLYYSVGCVVHRKWFRIRSWKPKYSTLHTEQVLPSYLAPPILPWQPTLMNWNCGGYLKSQVSKCALLCCWRFSFSSWGWVFPLNLYEGSWGHLGQIVKYGLVIWVDLKVTLCHFVSWAIVTLLESIILTLCLPFH